MDPEEAHSITNLQVGNFAWRIVKKREPVAETVPRCLVVSAE